MRSLVALDTSDLRQLSCPWCGRTPPRATHGFKVVRAGTVIGMVAAAPGTDLGDPYPSGAVVITQAWVRREDLGEGVGSQLLHRLARQLIQQRRRGVRYLVAPGTRGELDCRHLPGAFLDGLGFEECVAGAQWRLDLRRTVPLPDALRGVGVALGTWVRQLRPASAVREGSARRSTV